MSIPRFAIHRPVTMFMISGVVVLLGAISLTRLPVDLMPEFAPPVISVNVNYTGVGPLEMEELVTRPLEQAVSAVAGLERVEVLARIADVLNVPVVGLEALHHVVGAAERRGAIDSDSVVVKDADEVAEPEMTRQRCGFVADALHEAAKIGRAHV